MDISIVIVNYKTPQLLSNCIDSVLKETVEFSCEIIVVDNNSEDNSKEVVLKMFPDVRWLQLHENIGFAGGNNVGIKLAKGDYILLLNSDTIIHNNAIDKCVSYLKGQTDPSIAMLGCALLNKNHMLEYSSFPKRIWPNLKTSILQNVFAGKIISIISKNKNKRSADSDQLHTSTHFADAIAGSFILLRSSILNKTGLLDADFFLYFEEIEWAHRITKQGYKIVYYKDASIVHLRQGSSVKVVISDQTLLSQALFILKVYGKTAYAFYVFMYYINIYSGKLVYSLLSSENKASVDFWSKLFLPLGKRHFQILFKYKRATSSSLKPLKV